MPDQDFRVLAAGAVGACNYEITQGAIDEPLVYRLAPIGELPRRVSREDFVAVMATTRADCAEDLLDALRDRLGMVSDSIDSLRSAAG